MAAEEELAAKAAARQPVAAQWAEVAGELTLPAVAALAVWALPVALKAVQVAVAEETLAAAWPAAVRAVAALGLQARPVV